MLYTAEFNDISIHLEGSREDIDRLVRMNGLTMRKVFTDRPNSTMIEFYFEADRGDNRYAGFMVGLSPYYLPECANPDHYFYAVIGRQFLTATSVASLVTDGQLTKRYHPLDEWRLFEKKPAPQYADYIPWFDCVKPQPSTIWYPRNICRTDLLHLLHVADACPEARLWVIDTSWDAAEAWAKCPKVGWLEWIILEAHGQFGLPYLPEWRTVVAPHWRKYWAEIARARDSYDEGWIDMEERRKRGEAAKNVLLFGLKSHVEFV